ncbi:MAG TPA: choice-of-anchor D domain-containing protein [Terriglobales bacterium]
MAIGDFNNGGRPDILTPNFEDTTISVLLQTQDASASLSAASLAFGDQAVGSLSKSQTVTLTNTGAANLTISSIVVNDADFLESNNCPTSLVPFAHCSVSVVFKPGSSGPHSGDVTITDNAPGSPQTISLSGTGTFIALAPSSLNFGNVKVGQTSAPQTVTVTNVATHAVNIQSVRTSKPAYHETNTCGTSLAAKSSCTLMVTFAPNNTGTQTASLAVYDNAGRSPQTLSLTGTGD